MTFSILIPSFLRRMDTLMIAIILCSLGSAAQAASMVNPIIGSIFQIFNCMVCLYVLCRFLSECEKEL